MPYQRFISYIASPDEYTVLALGEQTFLYRIQDREYFPISGDVVIISEVSEEKYTGRYLTAKVGVVLYESFNNSLILSLRDITSGVFDPTEDIELEYLD